MAKKKGIDWKRLKNLKWHNKKQQMRATFAVVAVLASIVMILDTQEFGITGQAYNIYSVTVDSCEDTDFGKNYLESGTAVIYRHNVNKPVMYSDYCESGTKLHEFSCDAETNNLIKTEVSCRTVTEGNMKARCNINQGKCEV